MQIQGEITQPFIRKEKVHREKLYSIVSHVQAICKQAELLTCAGWSISTLYESSKLPISAFAFYYWKINEWQSKVSCCNSYSFSSSALSPCLSLPTAALTFNSTVWSIWLVVHGEKMSVKLYIFICARCHCWDIPKGHSFSSGQLIRLGLLVWTLLVLIHFGCLHRRP